MADAPARAHGDIDTLIRLVETRTGSLSPLAVELRGVEAAPPTTDAEIGFYGVEGEPARRRAWLAGLSRAEEAEVISSVEDKYAAEAFEILSDSGWLGDGERPEDLESLLGLLETLAAQEEPRQARATLGRIRVQLPLAARAIEAEMARRGLALVSFEATDGDTLFFTALSESERAALPGADLPCGIRPFDWVRFAEFVRYAIGDDVPRGD